MAAPDPTRMFASYAAVQRATDAEILDVLRAAYNDMAAQLVSLSLREGKGARIAEARALTIKAELLSRQAEIYRKIGNVIEARRAEAASRAITRSGEYDKALFEAAGRGSEAEALTRGLREANKGSIDVAIARLNGSSVPLQQRVYNTEGWANGLLQRRINSALARGLTAEQFAAEVRDFVNPNTPGGQRYAALRLARTEINNAFHAMAVAVAQDKPWITHMEWHLSNRHGRTDVCNTLAGKKFPKAEVPRKPHPQCLCYVTPVVDDEEEFLNALAGGEFDDYLDQFATRHNLPATPVNAPPAGPPLTPPVKKAVAKKAAPVKRAATKKAAAPPAKKASAVKKAPVKRAAKSTASAVDPMAPKKLIGKIVVPDIGYAAENKTVRRVTARIKDPAHKKRIADALNRQAVITPNSVQSLGSITVGPPTTGDGSNAEYHPASRKMIINPRTMTYSMSYRTNAHLTGWNSDCGHDHGDAAGTVVHEFGHHVHYSMMRNFDDERTTSGLVSLMRSELGIQDLPKNFSMFSPEFEAWFNSHKDLISRKVSKYGSTNLREFCAEVWTEYSTNPNARKHIKVLGEFMREQAELNRERFV